MSSPLSELLNSFFVSGQSSIRPSTTPSLTSFFGLEAPNEQALGCGYGSIRCKIDPVSRRFFGVVTNKGGQNAIYDTAGMEGAEEEAFSAGPSGISVDSSEGGFAGPTIQ